MNNMLSIDIGRKHTGIAFCDASIGIPLPLATIDHEDDAELVRTVQKLSDKRGVTTLILGLPLMSDGSEGEEVEHVRTVSHMLADLCPQCSIEFIDERLTSTSEGDSHAGAAIALLRVWLERASR
jgi:putative holliday junction resolvase